MLARAMVEELMQKLWLLSEEMWLNNLSEFILKLIQSKIEYRRLFTEQMEADMLMLAYKELPLMNSLLFSKWLSQIRISDFTTFENIMWLNGSRLRLLSELS